MCGIIGYTGYQNAKNIVLDGLKTLEYRGYDSAGIAFAGESLTVFKRAGRVQCLEGILPDTDAHCAIGHTRWATHGIPNATNAHPHLSFDKKIAIVHNGVIENYDELKAELTSRGIAAVSDTDSELIAHLLALESGEMIKRIERVGARLRGAASFLAIREGDDRIYLRKQGASLSVGVGDGECFVASDNLALSRHTKTIYVLNDGESAVLSPAGANFYKSGAAISKQPIRIKRVPPKPCSCHMRSEIDEIPAALGRTFDSVAKADAGIFGKLAKAEQIYLIGCGTAYHVAQYGVKVFENALSKPCFAISASELALSRIFAYGAYGIFITQSGETADVLIAIEKCKAAGMPTLAITNVSGSSASLYCDDFIDIDAGAEVAVAATKSYCCQLLALYLLAKAARAIYKGRPCAQFFDSFRGEALPKLSSCARSVLAENIFEERIKHANLFFVGSGYDHITAMESALKFKEITYKMADSYASGELKHGPIALIDGKSVAIVFATCHALKSRIETCVSELRSRESTVIAISAVGDVGANKTVPLPYISDAELYPIISVIPTQNLALATSLCLGLNPDRPRNLAKSVTVI